MTIKHEEAGGSLGAVEGAAPLELGDGFAEGAVGEEGGGVERLEGFQVARAEDGGVEIALVAGGLEGVGEDEEGAAVGPVDAGDPALFGDEVVVEEAVAVGFPDFERRELGVDEPVGGLEGAVEVEGAVGSGNLAGH